MSEVAAMEERTRRNLTNNDIWVRALYMVLFGVAFSLSRLIVFFLVVFQFFSILIAGQANEPLMRFAKNLNVYILEILEFLTFNSEIRPFPFTPWPDEEPGGEEWLDDEDFDDDDYISANEKPEKTQPDEPDTRESAPAEDNIEGDVIEGEVENAEKPFNDDVDLGNNNGATTH